MLKPLKSMVLSMREFSSGGLEHHLSDLNTALAARLLSPSGAGSTSGLRRVTATSPRPQTSSQSLHGGPHEPPPHGDAHGPQLHGGRGHSSAPPTPGAQLTDLRPHDSLGRASVGGQLMHSQAGGQVWPASPLQEGSGGSGGVPQASASCGAGPCADSQRIRGSGSDGGDVKLGGRCLDPAAGTEGNNNDVWHTAAVRQEPQSAVGLPFGLPPFGNQSHAGVVQVLRPLGSLSASGTASTRHRSHLERLSEAESEEMAVQAVQSVRDGTVDVGVGSTGGVSGSTGGLSTA